LTCFWLGVLEKFILSSVKKLAMGFLDLFIVALMPVLKILLITALGLLLGTERIDLLGANARQILNKVSSIFLQISVLFIILVMLFMSSMLATNL
jgi:hypothetical protein